ncbi:hypothetical protein GA0071314_2586 [Halomonas sp. HL-93]|nr:hypothetical protein GA0071314_2586 [Halomonas sp. HL-93]
MLPKVIPENVYSVDWMSPAIVSTGIPIRHKFESIEVLH